MITILFIALKYFGFLTLNWWWIIAAVILDWIFSKFKDIQSKYW